MTLATTRAWNMLEPGKLAAEERTINSVPTGEALIEVAGCGVCHTDLSFFYDGVKTRAEMPLTLGHEISGTVLALGEGADDSLLGKPVVVPAVMPCGECELCQAGERRICRKQIMPGNDRHGGFASHVLVPTRYVCPVPEAVLAKHELWQLAVIADAITTPFQAVKRAGLKAGELAVVIGTGGIGIYAVQIAKATGAHVIALDINENKLALAKEHGADATIHTPSVEPKALRKEIEKTAADLGAPRYCWRIFETSGTAGGQQTAFSLLTFGASVAVVGFTMSKLELRISNLMAFDASMFGIWGADPLLYPEVLDWIAEGRIRLSPLVAARPLDEIATVFEEAHHGKHRERIVLRPGA